MRIKYNILWIENEDGWLQQALDYVAEILDDNGFVLNPKIVRSEAAIISLLETEPTLQKYDLILVDFHLDKGDRGNAIIENIRDHKVYTEIIFYSQDVEGIRNIMARNFIDGIYVANRDGNEFRDKFEKVFLSTVKKAQDINNVRGLVISEASTLDDKIYSVIISFFKKYPNEDQQTIREYVFDEIIGNLEEKGKQTMLTFQGLSNIELLETGYFDAYKKMRILGRILHLLNNPNLVSKKEFNKRYDEEIIQIRNQLAHCIEKEDGDKIVLTTKKGDKTFDDEICKSIRKMILEHTGFLNAIDRYIQDAK
jgi:hypothetical protein